MKFPRAIGLLLFLSAGLIWTGCDGPPTSGGALSEAGLASQDQREVEPAEWGTDYERALALAAEQDRPVLINFTGSDWCPPCMALHREVFATAAFNEYAEENLILLELDFPRGKQQPRELVEQNQKLAEHYRIEGFPTLLLVDSKGAELKRGGYRRGGPRAFLNWVEG